MSYKADLIIECLNCKRFYGCKIRKEKKDTCVSFEERKKDKKDGNI